MRHRLIKATFCICFVALAGLAGGGTGCSAQGEGDRCTFFANTADANINGTSECQSGLVCTAAFNTTLYPFDRCCPPDLQLATNVPACYSGGNPGGSPDSSTDSPNDGATDGPSDGPNMDGPETDSPPSDANKSDAPPSDAKPADGASGG